MLQAYQAELRKRWPVIILLAILAAAALIAEKALTKEPVIKSTSLYVEQTVRIQYAGQVPVTSAYDRVYASYGSLGRFVQACGQDFDFSKLQPGWDGMTDEQKVRWMKKHFYIQDATSTSVNFALYISEEDWKDPFYASEHGPELLRAYIRYTERSMQELGEDVTFQLGESYAILPQPVQVSRRSLLVKYGIIGGVLGALAGLLIVLVLAVRNRHA